MNLPNPLGETFVVAVLILAMTAPANAQEIVAELPEHARAKRHGLGWECERGYREDDGACIAYSIPEHAYYTTSSYGRGWECKRGYQEYQESCNAILVPQNAYLNSMGTRWKCDRGYRISSETCLEIDVPSNGYLVDSSYGRGWNCQRGYREEENSCDKITLPENAHLDRSGNDWECDPPYHRQIDSCVLP